MSEMNEISREQCTIQGCPGHYIEKHVSHTFRREGRLIVIDGVPAEVCDVCGDVLFSPKTSRKLDRLVADYEELSPKDTAPVYEFA